MGSDRQLTRLESVIAIHQRPHLLSRADLVRSSDGQKVLFYRALPCPGKISRGVRSMRCFFYNHPSKSPSLDSWFARSVGKDFSLNGSKPMPGCKQSLWRRRVSEVNDSIEQTVEVCDHSPSRRSALSSPLMLQCSTDNSEGIRYLQVDRRLTINCTVRFYAVQDRHGTC